MRFTLRTKSGQQSFTGDISRRYKLIRKPVATDTDVVQFWTWLKYEFPRIDQNKVSGHFGAKLKDFEVNIMTKVCLIIGIRG